jgi:hypothetical protein
MPTWIRRKVLARHKWEYGNTDDGEWYEARHFCGVISGPLAGQPNTPAIRPNT